MPGYGAGNYGAGNYGGVMSATHGRKGQILMASGAGISMTNEAMTDAGDHQHYTITNSAKRYWDSTASFTVQARYDEFQTVTLTGSPGGGTFTLTFGGNTTSAIAYDAAASVVQSALAALASIGSGNVSVTGSAGGPWTVEFIGTLSYANQAQMTADGSGLTGGTSPGVSIATTQNGATWTTITSGFTLQYVGGKILLSSVQAASTQFRISGKYRVYAALAQAREWAPDVTRAEHEDTSMTTNTTPVIWRTFKMGLLEGTFKLSTWHADDTYFQLIDDTTTLIASLVFDASTALPRLECEGFLKKDSIKVMVDGLEEEDLDFRINGTVYLVTS